MFLPGWEEGLFPNQRSLDESGAKGLEEERRLAYVGLTRARRRAIVSHAANRRIYANWQSSIPSRFIDELPDDACRAHRVGARWRAMRGSPRPRVHGQFPAEFSRRAVPPVARRRSRPWEQPARPARSDAIPVGTRVFHQKFGYGTVTAAEDDRLDIVFDKAGGEARAGSVRGEGLMASTTRHGRPSARRRWRPFAVDVPEAALEAYEAALGSVCATVGLFRDEATGLWRIEGVKEVGRNEPELAAALALAAACSGVAAPRRPDADAGRGLARPHLRGLPRAAGSAAASPCAARI